MAIILAIWKGRFSDVIVSTILGRLAFSEAQDEW
jgi:hypothetical protein